MIYIDETQKALDHRLGNTEKLMNDLLSKKFLGSAKIKSTTDLGFPHDVIRIAGGFATGVYVSWESNHPFVPVDTCVNVCSASFFEIDEDISNIFTEEHFRTVKNRLSEGIYISNFHRGNHFVSFVKSCVNKKLYLLLHSSANEYKDNFNGLYPVHGNWYYDKIKTYSGVNTYINYIDGKEAEMFYRIAESLYKFNEVRHEFIAQIILGCHKRVLNVSHYHHYGMPSFNSIAMGCHVLKKGDTAPVLTMPGQNIYMVKFHQAIDEDLYINESQFITPHGWGKRHRRTPVINVDQLSNTFMLDREIYDIKFGSSLRTHPNLELRRFDSKNDFFAYLRELYEIEIIDEMTQICSWNKQGVISW